MTKMQAPKFWLTTGSIDPRIASRVTDVDMTPTLYYYGTCRVYLDYENEDPEGYGLLECDDEAEDRQAEAAALYRAEMRHCL